MDILIYLNFTYSYVIVFFFHCRYQMLESGMPSPHDIWRSSGESKTI